MSRAGTVVLLLLLGCSVWGAGVAGPEIVAVTKNRGGFAKKFSVERLPEETITGMEKHSWRKGCPVGLEELRLLTVSYWDFEARPAVGTMVVNQTAAKDLLWIFKKLYRHGFLIENMKPIESFDGSDERSMAANNTSAFNCRDKTGKPGVFSNHSWGLAVDINPLTNPYVRGGRVEPREGRRYLDRSKVYRGGILADSYVVRLFKKRGWTWGGDWRDLQDFQHFEKRERQ